LFRSPEHLNPMYVKPEEVVDKGGGEGEGASVENNTEGAELVGEDSS